MEKIIKVKVTPRSSVNKIGETLTDGTIKISLTASPTDGKANYALVKFLSEKWGIPKSYITIIKGLRGRLKTILIDLPHPDSRGYTEVFSKLP